jgi:hypothetical protein
MIDAHKPLKLRSLVVAFAGGAIYEACSVVWVHAATGGSAWQTALVSALQALASVAGIGESVRDWRVAPFFVGGYGLGAYLAMVL